MSIAEACAATSDLSWQDVIALSVIVVVAGFIMWVLFR